MLTARLKSGRMFEDGTRLSLPEVERSTEPDATFVSFASFRLNHVREMPGRLRGLTELEGSPDMVLEVVSDNSEEKDSSELPDLCYRAGILEYWRVDARHEPMVFEVFWRGEEGFIASSTSDSWRKSLVFGKWFQLNQSVD